MADSGGFTDDQFAYLSALPQPPPGPPALDILNPIDQNGELPPLSAYLNVSPPTSIDFLSMMSCHYSGEKAGRVPFWDGYYLLSNRPFSRLALQTLVVSTLPRVLHEFFKRFGLPLIAFQVAAGILFGPTGLGNPTLTKTFAKVFGEKNTKTIQGWPSNLFPAQSHENLDTWALFCGMFYLFKVGVKTDVTMIRRWGLKPIFIAAFCLFISAMSGWIAGLAMHLEGTDYLVKLIQISCNTSFPVIAIALTELNILNSDLGNFATSVSLYTDLIHFLSNILVVESGLMRKSGWKVGIKSISFLIAFFVFIFFVGRKATLWIARSTPEGKSVKEMYISFIFILVLVCGLASEVFGYYAMTGAFLIGLAVPSGPPLGSTLVNKLEDLVTSLYMPLMVALAGLKANIGDANDDLLHMELLILASFGGKFIGVLLPALFVKVPLREALLLGLVLNIKGVVDYNTINIFIDSKDLDATTSVAAVLTFPVVTAIFTPLVKYLYDPRAKYLAYKSRSIVHAKDSLDFNMLVCVHDTEDVPPILRLLENSVPTMLNATLSINLVHLIELVGRATPLLISHPPNKKISTSSNQSKTERIINVFRQFEECYQSIVSVKAFSTICPYSSMHNDIYNMAMEKRTSLIIVPFPAKHNEMEDSPGKEHSQPKKRMFIRNLLERAPCSVGIFVDRSTDGMNNSISMDPSMYHVGMLFFGGPDDREALAYAMKMSESSMVNLTVVRFVAPSDMTSFASKEGMHDNDMIDRLKNDEVMNNKRIVYSEEEVKDGAETSWAVRSMKDTFDLTIVGRRQIGVSNLTEGLDEWSEKEELGLIGDLVNSSDMGKGSILVIQVRQDE